MFKVLILAALMMSSLALFESGIKQGSLFSPENLSKLERSPLGRAIVHLAELQSRTSVDYTMLWTAIDELTDSLQTGKNEENTVYESDRQQYFTDQQFYQNQVTQYENEVAELNVDIQDLTNTRTNLEGQFQDKNNELTETHRLTQELVNLMERNENTYHEQMTDYNGAVAVIDEAHNLLSQVKESSSFLQHDQNAQKVAKLGENMKTSFTQLSNHHRIFFQPIVNSLINMATKQFADQQQLEKVLRYLDDIRTSLVNNRAALEQSYKNERESNENILNEYHEKASGLSDVVIPGLQEDIDTKNGEIATKQGILFDAQNNLDDAQSNLQATEERWLQRQNSHRELVDQYDSELQVINEATNALNRGGIVRN